MRTDPTAPTTFEEFVRRSESDRELADREARARPSIDLALMLVSIRKHYGWSQRELAKQANITQAYVAKLESGIANPSIQVLADLLRKLGVRLDLSATIVLNPKAVGETQLTEGEMYHLAAVAQGTANALKLSRVDKRDLQQSDVVGEIAAAYTRHAPGTTARKVRLAVVSES